MSCPALVPSDSNFFPELHVIDLSFINVIRLNAGRDIGRNVVQGVRNRSLSAAHGTFAPGGLSTSKNVDVNYARNWEFLLQERRNPPLWNRPA